jgi:hypothetical protein
MYRLSDVLAHFKGVCAFLKTIVQHASHQKEATIYYPCKVCKNDVMFKDHEVIREHLVRIGFMDEGFDVEELMCNVAPDVLLQRRNKGFNNFEILLELKASSR